MKTLKIIFLLILTVSFSCKEKPTSTKEKAKKETAKVVHYICANKCEGSGSETAGNCPVCKTPYTHNMAYHNNDFLKNGPLNVPKENLNTTTTTPTTTQSPAQNSAGVYHYTCSNGCSGGTGSAGKCGSCGSELAHNTAYHN